MIFQNTDELHQVMLRLWERIKSDPDMLRKLINSGLSVQFNYSNPEGTVTLDCTSGKDIVVTAGSTTIRPMIQMSMTANTAHEFWMGRVNVPMALLTGKIISRGPTPKALVLLPIITPAFKIYPEVLRELNKKHLLS